MGWHTQVPEAEAGRGVLVAHVRFTQLLYIIAVRLGCAFDWSYSEAGIHTSNSEAWVYQKSIIMRMQTEKDQNVIVPSSGRLYASVSFFCMKSLLSSSSHFLPYWCTCSTEIIKQETHFYKRNSLCTLVHYFNTTWYLEAVYFELHWLLSYLEEESLKIKSSSNHYSVRSNLTDSSSQLLISISIISIFYCPEGVFCKWATEKSF